VDQTKAELEQKIRRHRERLDVKLGWLDEQLDRQLQRVRKVPAKVGRATMAFVAVSATFMVCIALVRRFPPLRR
jgi:hypothetical protein